VPVIAQKHDGSFLDFAYSLTRDELAVLELVNGKNTVKEIIRKSRMGSFEVSKMLYRLLSIKLVRRRVLPVAV